MFRREGDDLHMVVPIAVHEAALGAKIEIRTLDGQRAAARAAGHAVGPAVPAARARSAVDAGRASAVI